VGGWPLAQPRQKGQGYQPGQNGVDYINFIIFDESTVSNYLNNFKVIKW